MLGMPGCREIFGDAGGCSGLQGLCAGGRAAGSPPVGSALASLTCGPMQPFSAYR